MPAPVLDGNQFGWIAAEVTCSKQDWSVLTAEIVQVAALDTENGIAPKTGTGKSVFAGGFPNLKGRRARFPIARIGRIDGQLQLWQIAYFDVQHRVKTNSKDPNADEGRHFFYV
jgi:phosphodiesterase/alkaline phosphatase D-like protein